MEAKALCESIFQFVGQAKPEHASTSRPSTGTAGIANEVGEGATAAAAATKTTQNGQPTTNDERHYNASPKHQMENEEIIRAFVGNKLGEYNMRGVEAGMAMVAVDNKNSGKTLHTKSRRQGRVDSRPYEKRPSRDRKGPTP
eukprot:jgi/Undpi1/4996/HiC_scaffold_19.g08348.m1